MIERAHCRVQSACCEAGKVCTYHVWILLNNFTYWTFANLPTLCVSFKIRTLIVPNTVNLLSPQIWLTSVFSKDLRSHIHRQTSKIHACMRCTITLPKNTTWKKCSNKIWNCENIVFLLNIGKKPGCTTIHLKRQQYTPRAIHTLQYTKTVRNRKCYPRDGPL